MAKQILHRNEKELIRIVFREARPLTINEVADMSGMSWITARKYLDICKRRGIMKLEKAGKKIMYTISQDILYALQSRRRNEAK